MLHANTVAFLVSFVCEWRCGVVIIVIPAMDRVIAASKKRFINSPGTTSRNLQASRSALLQPYNFKWT